MDWNALYSNEKSPSLEQVTEYINNPLWTEFNNRIQSTYRTRPCMEYSRCSMQAGWNIKYKKGGKSLCTLYPMEGYFIALVVVGSRELMEAELLIPQCSDYVQTVFKNTKTGNGQKWLMLEVRDSEISRFFRTLVYYDHDEAVSVYLRTFKRYEIWLFLLAVLGVFFVIFRMFVGNFSKYFQEINRGIDSLVNEDAQDIRTKGRLPPTVRTTLPALRYHCRS